MGRRNRANRVMVRRRTAHRFRTCGPRLKSSSQRLDRHDTSIEHTSRTARRQTIDGNHFRHDSESHANLGLCIVQQT